MVKLDKFNLEQKNQKMIGNAKRTEIKITLKSGKADITPQDIRDIVKGMEDNARKANKRLKLAVRGLNIHRWHTLKAMDGELGIEDMEDYYGRKIRVEQLDKFEDFSQLQLITWVE
jgi:hypothetical protein